MAYNKWRADEVVARMLLTGDLCDDPPEVRCPHCGDNDVLPGVWWDWTDPSKPAWGFVAGTPPPWEELRVCPRVHRETAEGDSYGGGIIIPWRPGGMPV